ncbi:MAG: molybdopterin-dependent oxidoreductase [Acidobacteria bacterium]|nr:molybdopterin-dependent oxidoreductase [Acidobacteriota bacterium]
MTQRHGIDRRQFVKLVGGGVVVLVTTKPSALLAQRRRLYPEDLNAYLRIAEDGRVTVFTGKIEMGQGVMTSQPQMVAEELRVAFDAVEIVMGDTARCPWDMGTFGSLTTRMFGPVLRAAAAEARAVMLRLAAEKLGVPRSKLVVENGVVSVTGQPTRKVTYGELAKGRRILRTVDDKAVLRKASEFTVMGTSPLRLDGHDKVSGAGHYAGDVRLPGMLYARILRPPAHGAKLTKLDTSAAAKIPGVTVVNKKDLVAVLHADPETADQALSRVKASWDKPQPPFDTETVFDHLVKVAGKGEVTSSRGDVAAARTAAVHVFESTFHKGYVAHAPIEPHTTIADVKSGKATVWASTQTPFPTRDRLAEELGLDPKNVRVITPYVGGGFGGKSAGLQTSEAAKLSQITGKPVQVRFSRAEEFFYDTFDPAAVVKLVSGLDANGKVSLWDYHVIAAGDRGAAVFYDIPNVSISVAGGWHGRGRDLHLFGIGPWRAPGANMNVFAKESQIDIMAAAARIDPVELRLRNLTDERMRRVLQAAAKAYGWKPRVAPAGKGRGRGVACGIDAGTYVTLMADVTVDLEKGTVHVDRVVAAQDMGIIVNPTGAKMQMEGCVTQGLGYCLSEELRFTGGEILDRNFDTYLLPRFSAVPKIETVLVRNDELDPQGGGEPAIVPMGAVIANAVFDATGLRFYRLPMTPERVRAALAKKGATAAAT